MPSGVLLLALTGEWWLTGNGNKYWENLNEQTGRTRWVDFAQHDYDSTQIEPIWHAWLAHIRKEPPNTDPVAQSFSQPWQSVSIN